MQVLTPAVIPEGVTTIEHCVFQKCTSLTSVTIPAGVTTIGIHAPQIALLYLGDYPEVTTSKFARSGCTSLTSVAIPAGVMKIGSTVSAKAHLGGPTGGHEDRKQRSHGAKGSPRWSSWRGSPPSETSRSQGVPSNLSGHPGGVTVSSTAPEGCTSHLGVLRRESPPSATVASQIAPPYLGGHPGGGHHHCRQGVLRATTTSVTILRVTAIGARAFAGCTSLPR